MAAAAPAKYPWSAACPGALLVEDGIALAPEVFRDGRFHFLKHPFTFRLQLPGFAVVAGPRIVRFDECPWRWGHAAADLP